MTLSTVLHPTDCSESAARALEVAARFATAHRATLVILHAELVDERLRSWAGSVTERVCRMAGVPVLAIRQGTTGEEEVASS